MFDLLYDSKLVIDESPVKCENIVKTEFQESSSGNLVGGLGPRKTKKRKNPPSGKTLANPGNAPDKEAVENEYRCDWCKKLFPSPHGRLRHSFHCSWNPEKLNNIKKKRAENKHAKANVEKLKTKLAQQRTAANIIANNFLQARLRAEHQQYIMRQIKDKFGNIIGVKQEPVIPFHPNFLIPVTKIEMKPESKSDPTVAKKEASLVKNEPKQDSDDEFEFFTGNHDAEEISDCNSNIENAVKAEV